MGVLFLYNPLNDHLVLYLIILLLFGIICYLILTRKIKTIPTKTLQRKKEKINLPKNDCSVSESIIDEFVSNYSAPIETPYLIGVCGGSGSGKTFISNLIVKTIKKMFPKSVSNGKNVVTISQDSYYKGGTAQTNYDISDAIDWELFISQLKELIIGNPIECPIYDFTTHSRKQETKTIYPGKIIIIEGILILTVAELRKLLNMKIFIHADESTLIFRRIIRDIKERGRTIEEVNERFVRDVWPSYKEYVLPSSKYADMTINNFNGCYVGPEVMLNHVIFVLKKIM